jgi:hypothetical protein
MAALLVPALLFGNVASAQDDTQELAKKLSNPIASLISVPFQFNYDSGGPNDGNKVFVNVQPHHPADRLARGHSGPNRRPVRPRRHNPEPVLLSCQADRERHHLGSRPAFLFPTATDDLLGGEKWGAGPTAVVLKQFDGWTVGMLANHIWSFAGDDDRSDISSTFLQPFVSYTTKDAWTFSLNTESSYNWETEEWSVPLNLTVAKLVVIEKQPISLTAGVRYWAESPDNGPDGFGFRTGITFLFPKK